MESVDPRIPPPSTIAGSGHSRYNRKAYDRIMGANTHYVTVVGAWAAVSAPGRVARLAGDDGRDLF